MSKVETGLLPCPFCGKKAKMDLSEEYGYYIECSGCGVATRAMAPTMDDPREIVIEGWNTRAASKGEVKNENTQ